MKTLDEIMKTPVLLLTPQEIRQLPMRDQQWAWDCQARHKLESECKGHEPTGYSTQRGWHNLRCKHCGKDMSYDSGD